MGTRQRRPTAVAVRRLALACCCLAALVALPAAPAAAAPTLTITPEGGTCGRDVTLNGAEFTPGARVTLGGPREVATNSRLATYRELATVVADDGRWAITTPFCAAGEGSWALVNSGDSACYAPSAPCNEFLYELASLPDPAAPPRPGSAYERGLHIRVTHAAFPGLTNTGGGGLAGRERP